VINYKKASMECKTFLPWKSVTSQPVVFHPLQEGTIGGQTAGRTSQLHSSLMVTFGRGVAPALANSLSQKEGPWCPLFCCGGWKRPWSCCPGVTEGTNTSVLIWTSLMGNVSQL
jgi:hypothetical protein